MNRILEEYKILYVEIDQLKDRIAALPKGTLHVHKIKGHSYFYHHYVVEGKRYADIVREPQRIEAQLEERRQLEEICTNKQKILQKIRPEFKYALRALQAQFREYAEEARRMKPTASENPYNPAHLIHRTARGDLVRSKSEVIIADLLYDMGIKYRYEACVAGFYPDFTVENPFDRSYIYIEHCGVDTEDYRNGFEVKLREYEDLGIVPGQNLIITGEKDGHIDAKAIENILRRHLTLDKYQTLL